MSTLRERKYLPTLADLIDRLSIVQLKEIFIQENSEAYAKERADIMHDIDVVLMGAEIDNAAELLHAAMIIMLTNRYIWENESKARNGEDQNLELLRLTHSINGIRNTAKNVISKVMGERVDLKVDCLAADLLEKYGNWNIWKSEKE